MARAAAAQGADIAFAPELISVGFDSMFDWAWPFWNDSVSAAGAWRLTDLALRADAPEVARFAALAKELGIAVGVTFLHSWDGPAAPRNSIALFDRNGGLALLYSKVHTTAFMKLGVLISPGNRFPVAVLDTAKGPVAVGSMICYDKSHPESARALSISGAELLLVLNGCRLERKGNCNPDLLSALAAENAVALVLNNVVGAQPGGGNNGWSHGFDHRGELLMAAPEDEEGVYTAHVDIAALRAFRRDDPRGLAVSRPEPVPEVCGMWRNPKSAQGGQRNFLNRIAAAII